MSHQSNSGFIAQEYYMDDDLHHVYLITENKVYFPIKGLDEFFLYNISLLLLSKDDRKMEVLIPNTPNGKVIHEDGSINLDIIISAPLMHEAFQMYYNGLNEEDQTEELQGIIDKFETMWVNPTRETLDAIHEGVPQGEDYIDALFKGRRN